MDPSNSVSSRSNNEAGSVGKRVRQRDHNAFQKVEGLEPRKMLAFEYVASYIEAESPFHQAGDVATPSLIFHPNRLFSDLRQKHRLIQPLSAEELLLSEVAVPMIRLERLVPSKMLP